MTTVKLRRPRRVLPFEVKSERHNMRMVRYDEATKFYCIRCQKDKKARNIASTANGLICNGCYGKLCSEAEAVAACLPPWLS